MSKDSKKVKTQKTKKDKNQIVLLLLLILVIAEVIMVPIMIYSKIVKPLPIIMFLVIPTLLAIGILLLSRNALIDYKRKQEKLNKLSK